MTTRVSQEPFIYHRKKENRNPVPNSKRGEDVPLPQAGKLGRSPNLIPPHGGGQHRTQRQGPERAHEQIAVLVVVLERVEHAQQRQARRGDEAREQRREARALPPLGVVGEPEEPVRVPHVVHGEDGASEGDAREGAPSDEEGLEGEGADVADKGDVRVYLARVAGLADGEPADQEDGKRGEPGEARGQGEEVELVGVADVVVKDAGPEACHGLILEVVVVVVGVVV